MFYQATKSYKLNFMFCFSTWRCYCVCCHDNFM